MILSDSVVSPKTMMKKLDDLDDYLKNNYPFFGKIKSIKILQHNNINSINYHINSDCGQYILRNFTDGSKSEKIERMCKILNFCIKNKVRVSEPIKNSNNKYVDDKNMVYLTRYYEGTTYNGTEEQLVDLAKNLAILHKTLKRNTIEYNYRTDINQYYRILPTKELRQIKRKLEYKNNGSSFDRKVSMNIDYLITCFSNDEKISKIVNKLDFKRQLIHRDLHPNNVIFNKNTVVAMIDFNGMRKSKIIEDIAFTSFRFALHKTNNINEVTKRIKLFVNTYNLFNEMDGNYIVYLRYFFIHEMLLKISSILRKKYLFNSNYWLMDFEKILNFVKLANKIKVMFL